MHGFDPLVVSSGKCVCCENKFGVIIGDFKQTSIFSFLGFFRVDLLRDLNIDFFVLPDGYKINLTISDFPMLTE